MSTLTSSGGHKSVNRSLLTGFVYFVQSKEFDEKFVISSLKMKAFVRRVIVAHTASSQQVVAVPKKNTESRRSQKVPVVFADRDDTLLREAGTE